jgi:hypothetical protein
MLREYLLDRDVPCPGCGYNLRALGISTCPECGQEIELRVGLVHPKMAGFIAGLIGLSAGAGFNGLLLIYVYIAFVVHRGMGGPPHEFYTVCGSGFLVFAAGAFVWIARGRRIRKLALGVRCALVGFCWLALLADIVLFSIMIR